MYLLMARAAYAVISLQLVLLGRLGCGTTPPASTDGGTTTNTDSGTSVSTTDVSISGELLFANNYPAQLIDLYEASFKSGSALTRVKLFARYCADEDCNTPIALVEAVNVESADENGFTAINTASTTGEGFGTSFTIPSAPTGSSYLQLIGDTQYSIENGQGACTSTSDCPGDADVLLIPGYEIEANASGAESTINPAAGAIPIDIQSGGELAFDGLLYLGHVHFDGTKLWEPEAPSDDGRLLAAVSNEANTFRNYIAILELDNVSSTAGQTADESYTLQKEGSDFQGDICGMVRGSSTLYAIGVDSDGANIFSLNAQTGAQLSDDPIVEIPPTNPADAATFPWPCRGVYASIGGKEHLYLINFKGAGSLTTSTPYPFVHVNVTDETYTTPFNAELSQFAVRGLVLRSDNSSLIGVEMSWSQDSETNGINYNRLIPFPLDGSGTPSLTIGNAQTTNLTSDEQCDSTLNWVSGLSLATLDGVERLLVGHDGGVAVYDAGALGTQLQDLDLSGFGRLFSQIEVSSDGTRGYALPQCKALTANSDFTLPYGATTEASDKNLVAILDLTGSSLDTASTTIDINGDNTYDHGIDLDFYSLKNYIRSFGSTLSIPPVVYTGPQVAVGDSMLFVRGTGIQGNGADSISSSGMGQVQDIGFFNLSTGQGVILNQYVPWFNGVSTEAGTSPGIWGYDIRAGVETSVSWLEYLP